MIGHRKGLAIGFGLLLIILLSVILAIVEPLKTAIIYIGISILMIPTLSFWLKSIEKLEKRNRTLLLLVIVHSAILLLYKIAVIVATLLIIVLISFTLIYVWNNPYSLPNF